MVRVEKTEDLELVRTVSTHGRLYGWLSDDYSPQPHMVKPEHFAGPGRLYLRAFDENQTLGVFGLHAHNGACVEIHTCLLPLSWGIRAAAAAQAAIQWVWKQTTFHRLITVVPEYNRQALQFALNAGMERYGVNPQSFLKYGKLHDQVLLGISRPKEANPCR